MELHDYSGGRYDAEVVVRWSNGLQETALSVKGIDVAAGQRLVAKAHERDRGAITASFSDVRAQPDSVHDADETMTPDPAPLSQIAQAPASPESTAETPAAAPPEQAPSSGPAKANAASDPAMTALKVAAAVAIVAVMIVLARRGNTFFEDGLTGEVIAGNRPVQN